jgi:hypothetical protein
MIQNLVWATGYNLVAIPIAVGGLVPWGLDLPMAVGAIAMSLSTIIVAANAQLLRRLTLRRPPVFQRQSIPRPAPRGSMRSDISSDHRRDDRPRSGSRSDCSSADRWVPSRQKAFSLPREIQFRAALPNGGTGKILKAELREPFWAGLESRVH